MSGSGVAGFRDCSKVGWVKRSAPNSSPFIPLTGGGDGFALLNPSYMTLVMLQAHKVNLKSPITGMDSLVCKTNVDSLSGKTIDKFYIER